MEKKTLSLTIILILIISLSGIVFAGNNVGLVESSQSQTVLPEEQTCLSYGVYNPWDESVNVKITVSDTLKEAIKNEKSKTRTIPANTFHDAAIPVSLCFEISQVYKENCLIFGILCKQTCEEEQKIYEGKIIVKQERELTDPELSDLNSTSANVTAPLQIKVQCTPYNRDYRAPIVLVILLLLGLFLGSKYLQKN